MAMKRPRTKVASLGMHDDDDLSSFSSASTYCSPKRRRKQQQTMEDAFRSFTIGKEKFLGGVMDAANTDDTMESVRGEDDDSSCSSLEDELLLTDQERVERKVLLELVFGKRHDNVVDAKLQEWIRKTALEANNAFVTTGSGQQTRACRDDMFLPSSNLQSIDTNRNNKIPIHNNTSCSRQRSNSLPSNLAPFLEPSDDTVTDANSVNDGMELSL